MKKCLFCEHTVIKGAKQVCKNCKAVYHSECWNVISRCINKDCLCSEVYTINLSSSDERHKTQEPKNPPLNTEYKTRVMDTTTKIAPVIKRSKPATRFNWKRLILLGAIPVVLFLFVLAIYLAFNLLTGNSVEKLYAGGVKKLEEEKYQLAVDTFEKAYEINPEYPDLKEKLLEAYTGLTDDFKDEYRYSEAIETLDKISGLTDKEKTKSKLIEIYGLWGENLLKQGSYQSALEKFEKVSELDETNENAHKMKVHTLVSMIYTPDYDVKEEQQELILSDKNCRDRLEKEGIKLYSVQCQILKVDLDKDGTREIIVAGEDTDSSVAGIDVYKVIAGKPKLLTSIDTSGYFLNKIFTVDINTDKSMEVFSNWTEPGTTKFGFTVMLFYKDGISKRDSTKISDCPVAFEDINNDGTVEIIGKKLYTIQFDGEDFFLPYIYQTQNYEFVDVTKSYGKEYKKLYIEPVEKKLENIPEMENYLDRVEYEGKIRTVIKKLYEIAGMEYDSKSGKKTPEETMQANFDYINKQEFYNAYMLRSSGRRELSSFESFYNLWRYNMSVKINELTLVSKDENEAEVKVVFEATDYVKPGETRTGTYTGNYILIKEGDLWYLSDSKVR